MSERTCSVADCDREVDAKGLCKPHYMRHRNSGDVKASKPVRSALPRATSVERYIADRVVVDDGGCWIWQVSISDNGYGTAAFDGQFCGAHRLSYETHKGPIPEGLVIDHLCRVTRCVNPEHLEAVSQRTNALRGEGPSALNAAKEWCDYGHEFTPENTYLRPDNGNRQCRTCNRRRNQELAQRRLLARRRSRLAVEVL